MAAPMLEPLSKPLAVHEVSLTFLRKPSQQKLLGLVSRTSALDQDDAHVQDPDPGHAAAKHGDGCVGYFLAEFVLRHAPTVDQEGMHEALSGGLTRFAIHAHPTR